LAFRSRNRRGCSANRIGGLHPRVCEDHHGRKPVRSQRPPPAARDRGAALTAAAGKGFSWKFRFSSAWRRSRERRSPEWRHANRQSGDWRTQISNPSSHINFGIQANQKLVSRRCANFQPSACRTHTPEIRRWLGFAAVLSSFTVLTLCRNG
jgi:hypothetical protein